MRPLNLLYTVGCRWIGGAERIACDLAAELKRRNHQVTIVCPPGSWTESVCAEYGVPTVPISLKRLVRPLAPFAFARALKDVRPDIVHAHLAADTSAFLPAARRAHIQTVMSIHGFGERVNTALADRIHTVSLAVRDDILQHYPSSPPIDVIPNGVPESLIAPREDNSGHRRRVVGMVARLTPGKSCDVFLRAAALVDEAEYVVVGYGRPRYVAELKELARGLNIDKRVHFVEDEHDARRRIGTFDLLVCPSRREAFGIVLLEAMSLGVPVIASASGGIPEIVSHGINGLLVPPDDPTSLADAIRTALADEGLLAEIRRAALDTVRSRFSIEVVVDRMEQLYRGMMADD